MYPELTLSPMAGFITQSRRSGTFYQIRVDAKDHRFDLRFLRPFHADFSIKKSSSFFPPLIAATSQRGLAPRPAQVSLMDHDISVGLSFLSILPLP
jgi:hypothetical protein